MKKQTRMRLCFASLVLAASLGFTGLTEQGAVAAPCCSSCDARFNACLQGILYPECGGDYSCCDAKTDSCYRFCSFSC